MRSILIVGAQGTYKTTLAETLMLSPRYKNSEFIDALPDVTELKKVSNYQGSHKIITVQGTKNGIMKEIGYATLTEYQVIEM